MKKLLALVTGLLLSSSLLFAQVLSSSGVKNTLSTSFGLPYANVDASGRDVRFYGLLETLQIRYDVGKFTAEGMLNWGALANWNVDDGGDAFTFANTGITPFYYTNNHIAGGGWWTNPLIEGYYVNFIFHPTKNIDLGMGTRLNWVIGPAPSSLDDYWGYKAHLVQGGLKDAAPGNADVAGYTYYANCYTSYYQANTKAALGARFRYEDFIEAGIAIPSGVTTSTPLFNAAVSIHPVDFIRIALAFEGVMRNNGNFYTGISFDFKNFLLDTYLAVNFRNKNTLLPDISDGWGNQWGTGAAFTFTIPKISMTLRPEVGFSFYNESEYSMAWYTGARMDFAIGSDFVLGAWSSFAFGAYDKRWYDKDSVLYHPDYTGGRIFDLRPDFTWNINKSNALTLYVDYQSRLKYTGENYNTWASGLYWTYKR